MSLVTTAELVTLLIDADSDYRAASELLSQRGDALNAAHSDLTARVREMMAADDTITLPLVLQTDAGTVTVDHDRTLTYLMDREPQLTVKLHPISIHDLRTS